MAEYINTYFGDLIFCFLENTGDYAIYGSHINSQLGGDKERFVIALVPSHMGIKDKCKLNELHWVNIQTRLLPSTKYKSPKQRWQTPDKLIPHIALSISSRDNKKSIYNFDGKSSNCKDFPFEVTLLHDPKKNTVYQYPNNINFIWAVDQFQTVFTPIQPIQQYKQENVEFL